MELSCHDFSEECAVPWIVGPGGKGAEYDPGCTLADRCFYPLSDLPLVPVAPIMVDQQGTSPNSAQYQSVEGSDVESGNVDQEEDCDSPRSQQQLSTRGITHLYLPTSTGEDIRPPVWIQKINDGLGALACGWKSCKRPGPYADRGTLMRHLRSQHVAPQSIECPYERCKRLFNRKDNMEEHLRRVHNIDRARRRSLPHLPRSRRPCIKHV